MKKIFFAILSCLPLMFVGCTLQREANHPQIAPLPLSAEQLEILHLIAHNQQEILLFEHTLNDYVNEIEIWVEVYHYGEFQKLPAGLTVMGNGKPLEDGRIAIIISQLARNEFVWSISMYGSHSISGPWTPADDFLASARGTIQEAHTIKLGQEIILHVLKFTNAGLLRAGGDLQVYLYEPGLFARYTYVHFIKARFR